MQLLAFAWVAKLDAKRCIWLEHDQTVRKETSAHSKLHQWRWIKNSVVFQKYG